LDVGSAVLCKIVQQIKKGKDLEEQDEANEQQQKVENKIAQEVVIQNLREPADEPSPS
jgi:hypothetical protein